MHIDPANRSLTVALEMNEARHSCPLHEKIKRIFSEIFHGLKEIVSFPLRYLGSKTWSIPGIIVRTPILLFKRIFFQEPLTKVAFFGTGYYSNNGPQLSVEETKDVLRYAAFGLVPFRYEQDKWAEPFGAKVIAPAALNVDLTKLPGNVKTNGHAFFDRNNLFKAMVLEDEHEMVVTFGPMYSHLSDISDAKESSKKVKKQLRSIIANYAGLSPQNYDQADALMEQLKKIAQEKNKRLVVTGQSLAGSIASYVALKHEIKGICFNSVQLGAGLQSKIGDAKLAKADMLLTQIHVQRDLVSQLPGIGVVDRALSAFGVRTPGTFGQRRLIPSAFKDMRSSHDYPVKSMMNYLGYDKNAKASELKQEDIKRSQ
ncbi:MAG: hypothetical protein LLG04_18300 [Parachlamydia sp.]|nr:hypothetical protein [Parachlamydia sp.]